MIKSIVSRFAKKNATTTALAKLNGVTDVIPAPDILNVMTKMQSAYKEHRVTEFEYKKIEAQKEVLITEITRKYDLYHYVFERIFDERKMAISKSFEIIDEGLKSNDRELINIGMQGLSKIVSSSPFANVEQLTAMLNSNKVIEI